VVGDGVVVVVDVVVDVLVVDDEVLVLVEDVLEVEVGAEADAVDVVDAT
jgi:hypothetical protein